jgi:hypothetical protein
MMGICSFSNLNECHCVKIRTIIKHSTDSQGSMGVWEMSYHIFNWFFAIILKAVKWQCFMCTDLRMFDFVLDCVSDFLRSTYKITACVCFVFGFFCDFFINLFFNGCCLDTNQTWHCIKCILAPYRSIKHMSAEL